jgi:hypothetical protein
VDAGRLTRRPTPPRRLPAAFFLNEHRRRVADIAVDRAEEANDGGLAGRDRIEITPRGSSYFAGTVIGLPLSTICTVSSLSGLSPTTV